MKTLLLSLFFICFTGLVYAQSALSFETQVYPAGIIPAIRFDYSVNEQIKLFARGAFNYTDRRDWGEQDNEEGGGAGFGLGVEFSNSRFENWSMNVRTDLWFMEIDWEDSRYIPCPPNQNCTQTLDAMPRLIDGTTKVTVLQPTLGFGYQIPISDSFFVKPSLNLGYEINIKTKGENVGEGAILLGGIQMGFSF